MRVVQAMRETWLQSGGEYACRWYMLVLVRGDLYYIVVLCGDVNAKMIQTQLSLPGVCALQ